MAKRFEADYDDFAFIDKGKLLPLFVETEEFIATIIEVIKAGL